MALILAPAESTSREPFPFTMHFLALKGVYFKKLSWGSETWLDALFSKNIRIPQQQQKL